MNRQFWGEVVVGSIVIVGLVVVAAAPGHAWTRGGWGGGGGWHGGFHGSSGVFNHHVFVSNRTFAGHHFGHHFAHHFSFRHHVFFHPCCFGPRVFFGVGLVAPFWYPYPYPVYSPPVAVASSAPVYGQDPPPQQEYWYYCQNSQTYYPYVKECPGGWLQVVPQASPPSQ